MARIWWRRTSALAMVSMGGSAGALARYGVQQALATPAGAFPWSTFAVNVSGSLAIGVLLTVLSHRWPAARRARLLLGTGVLGGFTTFSTMTVDAAQLVHLHHAVTAALYVAATVVCGLAAVASGVTGARLVLERR